MKRPNVFEHMVYGGLGSGFVLALLFAGLYFDSMVIMIYPYSWIGALLFGSLPGMILGLVDAFLLWLMLKNPPIPFTRAEMRHKSLPIYMSIFLTTVVLFSVSVLPIGIDIVYPNLDLMPIYTTPVFAGIAATYAAHRYLFRLMLWSETASATSSKKKKKNDERSRKEILDDYYDYEQSLSDEQHKQEQHS